ncbi:hypothetical protein T11_14217 [Trichinella zimbabwensis]|uniref:Uncharacterized protein n=1 Tax=Trichinella zimbabwensis TaxID=268475 RepID=A0A0V1GXF6_9BILA|nr:hypothetical protein T11_2512 [Trichinella zimbabwensis]KRZ02956.1 hypothetical protein T11_14217 [Trichinella zimbabwensis]
MNTEKKAVFIEKQSYAALICFNEDEESLMEINYIFLCIMLNTNTQFKYIDGRRNGYGRMKMTDLITRISDYEPEDQNYQA